MAEGVIVLGGRCRMACGGSFSLCYIVSLLLLSYIDIIYWWRYFVYARMYAACGGWGGYCSAEIVMVRADLKKNERGSTRKIQTVVFVWGGANKLSIVIIEGKPP